jgi:carbamoylphosphate synthase large subunit
MGAVATVGDAAQNDITRETPASFEPGIDYVVTKIPGLGSRNSCKPPPQTHQP